MALGKNCVVFCVLLLFAAFPVDAEQEELAPVYVKTPLRHDFVSPNIHFEIFRHRELALEAMGASTYEETMIMRRSSWYGYKSSNITVVFSVDPCKEELSPCQDSGFTIFEENEANFTVVKKLFSNEVFSSACAFSKQNLGNGFYNFYERSGGRPFHTQPYKFYFVVFTCGELPEFTKKTNEFGTKIIWWYYLDEIIGVTCALVVLFIVALVIFVCFRNDMRAGRIGNGDMGMQNRRGVSDGASGVRSDEANNFVGQETSAGSTSDNRGQSNSGTQAAQVVPNNEPSSS